MTAHTLAEGERIQVKTRFFEGQATILYIAPGEFYPVQVEMDEPDPDGHKIHRFALHEVVKDLPAKTESPAETFTDPERFLGEVIQDEAGYSFQIGQQYILEKRREESKSYYLYDAESMKFRGCMPASMFKVLGVYDSEQVVSKSLKTSQEEPKAVENTPKSDTIPEEVRYEQMSLLDFL